MSHSVRDLLDGATWETASGMPATWTPPEQRDPRQVAAEREAEQRWVRAKRRMGDGGWPRQSPTTGTADWRSTPLPTELNIPP